MPALTNNKCGFSITIECSNGDKFTYCHMNNPSSLSQGANVLAGEPIGNCGNSGSVIAGPGSDGAHVHVTYITEGGKDEYDNHTDSAPSSANKNNNGC